MNPDQVRMECLRLALSPAVSFDGVESADFAHDVCAFAAEMAAFVMNGTIPPKADE